MVITVLKLLPFRSIGVLLLAVVFTPPCLADPARANHGVLARVLETGVLRVGINPHFEPFSYVEKQKAGEGEGSPVKARVGIDIDIAKLLADGLSTDEKKVRLEIVVPEKFEQLIPMLQAGEIDIAIAALSRVFTRALKVDFSDPYYHTGFSILLNVVKGYHLGIGEALNYEDLKTALKDVGKEGQLVIAVTQGKSAAGFIQGYFPKAKIEPYETNEEAARAVLADTPEPPHLMVHDEIFLKLWAKKLAGLESQKMVVFDKPFRSDTYGFAVAKGNLDFIQVLNLFIADKLFAEGRMQKFTERRYHRYIPGIGIVPQYRGGQP